MNFTEDIQQSLRVLHSGGIILYPTDTVWGIGCDATNDAAVERIIQLKQRPNYKSFVTLIADMKLLEQDYVLPPKEVVDYLQTAMKPTTVIYENVKKISKQVIAPNGSAAIRIPSDSFCSGLLAVFQKPLVSTSANISGMATPSHFAEIDDIIKNGVDYVVKYKQDNTTPAQASSIICWNNEGINIIRE